MIAICIDASKHRGPTAIRIVQGVTIIVHTASDGEEVVIVYRGRGYSYSRGFWAIAYSVCMSLDGDVRAFDGLNSFLGWRIVCPLELYSVCV